MLATSLLLVATDGHGNGFEGLFILCGVIMAAFVVSGWYFTTGTRGHLSKKVLLKRYIKMSRFV